MADVDICGVCTHYSTSVETKPCRSKFEEMARWDTLTQDSCFCFRAIIKYSDYSMSSLQ